MAGHFRSLARGQRLAIVYSGPHSLGRQVRNVSHGVLVSVAIGGEVPKIRDARNEAAIVLPIEPSTKLCTCIASLTAAAPVMMLRIGEESINL
jgi:hypothetical protein